MSALLLVARLLLALILAVAGIAKLLDRDGSSRTLREFGVPRRLASPLGVVLPLVELVTAMALVSHSFAWWGALAALALLLTFIGGISFNMARGQRPDCHCFGQIHSEPAGWRTLIRNGVLALLATLILVAGWDDPGLSVSDSFGDVALAEGIALGIGILALALLAAEGWLLIQLVGQNGRLLIRLEEVERRLRDVGLGVERSAVPSPDVVRGLIVGTPAPEFALPGVFGETITLDNLRAPGNPVMLTFSDPDCGPCNALLPEIGRWQRDHADRLTIALVSRGTTEANRSKTMEHALTNVLLQNDREVADGYRAHGTPSAVIVGADGSIARDVALGVDAIRTLVSTEVGPKTVPVPMAVRPAGPGIGASVPALTLPDLEGREVRIAELSGDPTLIVFWNPGCGYCARMLDDLRALDTDLSAGEPTMVVVSTGDVEINRSLGLRAPILLDQHFAAGRAFGASGTPSAVRIDADGRIDSAVAVGAEAVLALARKESRRVDKTTNVRISQI